MTLRCCYLLLAALTIIVAGEKEAACESPGMHPPDGFSFSGDWNCTGAFPANGRVHRSTYHGELSTDGKWTELTETDIEPKDYIGRYLLSEGSEGKKVVFIDTNSAGYAIFDGPGWDVDNLTVTSTDVADYTSSVPKNRFIYTAHDAEHFDVEWQVSKESGWISGDLLHCSKGHAPLHANYFVPDVRVGKTYATVFSRTISFRGEGMDEFVRRVAGTATTTITKAGPEEIDSDDVWRYDGIQEGQGTGQRKDAGRTGCSNGKCYTSTDGSGTFFNALFWGNPPGSLQEGTSWTVHIDVPWELGPAGLQTVTVLSVDPGTGTILLKREGSGDGSFAGDMKAIPVVREGKTYKVEVEPGKSHWVGQTIFRRGVVLSDELMVERPVTLSSADFGKTSAIERQFILLNAAP